MRQVARIQERYGLIREVPFPASQIWGEAYFRDDWQLFFDGFNSLPAAVLGFLIAGVASPKIRSGAQVFFGSVILHIAIDLPLQLDIRMFVRGGQDDFAADERCD